MPHPSAFRTRAVRFEFPPPRSPTNPGGGVHASTTAHGNQLTASSAAPLYGTKIGARISSRRVALRSSLCDAARPTGARWRRTPVAYWCAHGWPQSLATRVLSQGGTHPRHRRAQPLRSPPPAAAACVHAPPGGVVPSAVHASSAWHAGSRWDEARCQDAPAVPASHRCVLCREWQRRRLFVCLPSRRGVRPARTNCVALPRDGSHVPVYAAGARGRRWRERGDSTRIRALERVRVGLVLCSCQCTIVPSCIISSRRVSRPVRVKHRGL